MNNSRRIQHTHDLRQRRLGDSLFECDFPGVAVKMAKFELNSIDVDRAAQGRAMREKDERTHKLNNILKRRGVPPSARRLCVKKLEFKLRGYLTSTAHASTNRMNSARYPSASGPLAFCASLMT